MKNQTLLNGPLKAILFTAVVLFGGDGETAGVER
jgi:hypothetical protein